MRCIKKGFANKKEPVQEEQKKKSLDKDGEISSDGLEEIKGGEATACGSEFDAQSLGQPYKRQKIN